jgi:hypothetical protein
MIRFLWFVILNFISIALAAQGFEVLVSHESVKVFKGESLKTPVRFKNTSDKTMSLVVKRAHALHTNSRSLFCLDNNCLDAKADEFIVKVESGQTSATVLIVLESGLPSGESQIKYMVYNKASPTDAVEFDLNIIVEEKPERHCIYTSKYIKLYDVYPNPVSEYAFVDYKILSNKTKARIVIHNVLGNTHGEYALPVSESKIKIHTEAFNAGIYFYTLYVDNEGILTRKLIVKN